MKKQMLLGLCLGGCLTIAAAPAMADDGKSNNRSARAVQVHIDKEGRKTAADDSSVAVQAASVEPSANVSMIMPSMNQAPQLNADGSTSVRLGTESLKYLFVTVGEDGQMAMSHRSSDEVDAMSDVKESDKGDK
jgi:hypothetical protein